MTYKINQSAIDLAKAFHAIVVEELAEQTFEIDELNAKPDYEGACATHDFCDANELMMEAFETTFDQAFDMDDDYDVRLWNMAWDKARTNGFSKPWAE